MRWLLVLVLVGCGDNLPCDPPSGPAPTGKLSDPYAFDLPDDCVPDGIANATGRWFLLNPNTPFDYSYPQITGSCGAGFRYTKEPDTDVTLPNGYRRLVQTWSDSSRLLERTEVFDPSGTSYFVQASATCLRANGNLFTAQDGDGGTGSMEGGRFELRDGLADKLVLVGEIGHDASGTAFGAYDLEVDGDHAFLVGVDGLVAVDVHDHETPAVIARYLGAQSSGYNDVVLVHGQDKVAAYLSAFDGVSDTDVVDVTDPSTPAIAARVPDYSHTMTLRGNQLYLANNTSRIPIYDVSTALAPAPTSPTYVPGPESGMHDMWIDGTTVYANYGFGGFVVFDIATNLAHPTLLGQIPSSYSHTSTTGTVGGRRIILDGDEGWAGDQAAFLRILDGDPSSPTFLTELARYSADPRISIHNFQLVGERLYIAYYQAGVRVVDLHDPTQPREVAHYNTWTGTADGYAFTGALGIQVVGNLIYVADSERGLIILRDPAL